MDEFDLEDNLEFIFQSIEELMDEEEHNPFGVAEHNEFFANLVNYENVHEEQLRDVSAADVANGMDMQGIPWEKMLFRRDQYREMKMKNYRNYQNLSYCPDDVAQECKQVEKGSNYFDFHYNARGARPSIVHFQLRNLVWATSKHDVYTMHNQSVTYWSSLDRTSTELINTDDCIIPKQRGHGSQSVAMVQVTTMAVQGNLLVTGGFQGELICKRLDNDGVAFSTRVTEDENAITNSLDIYEDTNRLVAGNNDCSVRIFDTDNFALLKHFSFPWSVNSVSVSPNGKLFAVLGDHEDCLVVDAKSGNAIETLKGHLDYSFASAWHPDGRVLATGSQDTTCRLWDIRNLSQSFAVLGGRIGSIRTIKFSSDGRFLATAEPVDFVHVYDCNADYGKSQDIDLFGEIAGLSFSPDAEAFYVGIGDLTYGGLLEFNRKHQHGYLNCMW